MSDELTKYLDALSSEGQAHSRGEFTVDFRRARELLKGALYEHPATYLIKLIQAAIRSRAQEIKLRIECHAVSVAFRPHTAPLDLEIVARALNAPLETDRDGFLRDLALGLQAASGLEPSVLLWGHRDASGGEALVLTPDGHTRRVPLPAGSEPECVFQLRRSQVRWRSAFSAALQTKFQGRRRKSDRSKGLPGPQRGLLEFKLPDDDVAVVGLGSRGPFLGDLLGCVGGSCRVEG